MSVSFPRKLGAEFTGTFFLLATVVGSGIMADRLAMSVGDLFLGAVFPGLLLGFLYIIYIIVVALLRPDMAPAPAEAQRITAQVMLGVLRAAVPPALLILAVLVLGSGCCGHAPTHWWEPVGHDCAPCGDPCDLCDPRH